MTLYELTNEWKALYEQAEDMECSQEAWEDTLEMIEGDIEEKAEGYGKIIKMLEAECKAARDEEIRIAENRRVLEKKVESMKKALMNGMTAIELKKLQTPLFKINIRTTSSVEIPSDYPLETLPFDCVRTKLEADKTAIKAKLEAGEEIDGIQMVKKDSITIK